MTKKGQKFGLKIGIFLIVLKKDHRKKFWVENRKFFGKYLKKTDHREFGVPGNVIYKKALNIYMYLEQLSLLNEGFTIV